MHRKTILNTHILFLALLLLMAATPVAAQRTGDHIVPSIETVCDGDPFNFGLCNAYCEALDCDSDTPLGTPQACANKLKNYVKHSGGALPPCEQSCPCNFDSASDFAELEELGNEEFAPPYLDPATIDTFCSDWGPNGENAFVQTELQFIPTDSDDPQGIALYYLVTDETDDSAASCQQVGIGFDGLRDLGPDGSYFFFERNSYQLSDSEAIICREVIAKLCP